MGAFQGTKLKVMVPSCTPGTFVFTSWEVLITTSNPFGWSKMDVKKIQNKANFKLFLQNDK